MENKFVSCILSLNDTQGSPLSSFSDYLKELHDHLNKHYSDYEIIILDMSSKFPHEIQKEILKNIPSIRWLTMAFLINNDFLIYVGLENAIGDYVVFLRALVDPSNIVNNLVTTCQKYDMIVGVSDYPKTWPYKVIRKIGSRVLKAIDYTPPSNATPVRCLSRESVNMILNISKSSRFSPLRNSINRIHVGEYKYNLTNPNLLKKRTLFCGVKDFSKIIFFYSKKSFHFIGFLGTFGSTFAFFVALYTVLVNFFKDHVVEGWTTIMLVFSMLFAILFIIIISLNEYLETLINKNNYSSLYVLKEQKSTFMINKDKYNVF